MFPSRIRLESEKFLAEESMEEEEEEGSEYRIRWSKRRRSWHISEKGIWGRGKGEGGRIGKNK